MTLGGYYLEFPASYALIAAFTLIFFAGLNDTNITYKGMLSTYNIKHNQYHWYSECEWWYKQW
jgi:hypothetical protein